MKSLSEYMVCESRSKSYYKPAFVITTNMRSSHQSNNFGFVTAKIQGVYTIESTLDGAELGSVSIEFECEIIREDCKFTKFEVSDTKMLDVFWRVMGWDDICRLFTKDLMQDNQFPKQYSEAIDQAVFSGLYRYTPEEHIKNCK